MNSVIELSKNFVMHNPNYVLIKLSYCIQVIKIDEFINNTIEFDGDEKCDTCGREKAVLIYDIPFNEFIPKCFNCYKYQD